MPLTGILLTVLTLLVPSIAAKEVTVWDFQGNVPGRWEGGNLTSVTPTKDGLHFKTATAGKIRRNADFPHPVDALSITVHTSRTVEITFMWHARGGSDQEFIMFPFTIDGRSGPQRKLINLSRFKEWNPNASWVGFSFSPGTDLLLQKIELFHWNPLEKLIEGWKSFWTFDQFTSYSINFLWGPLLAFNPIARSELFAERPPYAWSVNRLFYALMIIAGCTALLWVRWKGPSPETHQRGVLLVASLVASIWILYDIRMGAELLSYVWTDARTYISQPIGKRTLRTVENFYDVVEMSKPWLPQRYAIVAPTSNLLLPIAAYLTYPKLPLPPDGNSEGILSWIVFLRPDVSLTKRGELAFDDGSIFTPPGAILQRFSDSSFLFQVSPPPPTPPPKKKKR